MADWNKPTNTSAYTSVLGEIHSKIVSVATLSMASDTNLPANAIQYNQTTKRWQKWSGSAWGTLNIHDVIADKAGTETVTGAWSFSSALTARAGLTVGYSGTDGTVTLNKSTGVSGATFSYYTPNSLLLLNNQESGGATSLRFGGVDKYSFSGSQFYCVVPIVRLGNSATVTNNWSLVANYDGFQICNRNDASEVRRLRVTAEGRTSINYNETLDHWLSVGGNILSTGITLKDPRPTVNFADTDHRSAILQADGGNFYLLRGTGVGATSWITDETYPLTVNLEDKKATFGGNITISNSGPTLAMSDTNARGAIFHVNDGYFYLLRATAAGAEGWNSADAFPFKINLENLATTVAGSLTVDGGVASGGVSSAADLSLSCGSTAYRVKFPNTASVTLVSANAYLGGDNGINKMGSSIRYKRDVETIEQAKADAVLELRPVWYRSKCEGERQDWSSYGLIAEEVAEIEPRLVSWVQDEDGKDIPDGVFYDRLGVLLLSVIQRQAAVIKALEQRVAALESSSGGGG